MNRPTAPPDSPSACEMRGWRIRYLGRVVGGLLLGLALLMSGLCPAWAQPPEPVSPPTSDRRVREEQPRVFYLKDRDGNYVYVPQFSFEEYKRLDDLKRQMRAPDAPHYVIERMLIEGQVTGNQAVLDVRLELSVQETPIPAGEAWTKIPLRFENAVLRKGVTLEGPGRHFTQKEQGLICWLQVEAGSRPVLTAQLVVPVRRILAKSQVAIEGPVANTSKTVLRLPIADAEASVQESTNTVRVVRALPDGKTEVVVEGSGGDLHIEWSEAGEQGRVAPARLNVDSKIRFTIHDPDSVTCRADLKIRNSGGEIPEFDVRLPPDMEWTPRASPGFEIQVQDASSDSRSQWIHVRPKPGAAEELHLEAELKPAEKPASDRVLDVSGFEVLGAVRQRGQIEFVVPDDWSLATDEDVSAQRVDLASEPAAPSEVAARFRYSRQPYALKVRVKRKQRDIRVEQGFEVSVKPKSIELELATSYHVRGARTSRFELDAAGWTIVDVGPEELVQSFAEVAGKLTVDVKPVAGSFLNLKVSARQDVAAGQTRIAFRLPRPLERTVSPARVLVRAAQNIELTPLEDQMRGLVIVETPSDAGPLPSSQWNYLEERSAEGATFVADYKLRTRSLSVAVETLLTFDEREIQVHEDLTYDIAYGSADRIALSTPGALILGDRPQLSVKMAGASLEPRVGTRDSESDRVPVEYRLPSALSGQVRLTVDFALPTPTLPDRSPHDVVLGLALPEANDQTTLDLRPIRVETGPLQVNFGQNVSTVLPPFGSFEGPLGGERRLKLVEPYQSFGLSLATSPTDQQTSVVVRQAWVQSWLDPTSHEFRSVFRIYTNQRTVSIQLPDRAETPVVAINHKELIAIPQTSSGQLTIKVPPDESDGELLIEVWYHMPAERGWAALFRIQAPQVVGASRVGRTYWQVVTPRNRHLLWSPSQLTQELVWQWRGWYWGRQANSSEHDLEDWIGATQQTEGLPADTNQYLFTSLGPTEQFEIVTAPRHVIVLVFSGAVLVVGLTLLYWPALRTASLFFVAGVVLCALAILFPEPAALLAQAAVGGLGLLLLARLLDVFVARRQFQPGTVRGRTHIATDTKAADLRVVPIDSDSPVTTKSAPAAIRITPSHGKP